MCPPDFYEIREPDSATGAANDFENKGFEEFKKNQKEFRRAANAQWQALKSTFVSLGVEVVEIEPKENHPDLVFTADPSVSIIGNSWNLSRNGNANSITILSRFSNKKRQNEVAINAAFFERNFPDRAILESHFRTEGSGDNVYDVFRDTYWSGYNRQLKQGCAAAGRSDKRSHQALIATFGVEVISLPVMRPFFHIDTSLAPLSKGHIVFYEKGILPDSLHYFRKRAFADYGLPIENYLIPVSKKDADRLACNLVCINDTVVMPACSQDLQDRIRKAGYEVVTRDVSRFIAAGGAVHCLINNINQQRVVGGLASRAPKQNAQQLAL